MQTVTTGEVPKNLTLPNRFDALTGYNCYGYRTVDWPVFWGLKKLGISNTRKC